jgi:hypothetical protein
VAQPQRVGHPVWLDWWAERADEVKNLRAEIAALKAQTNAQQELLHQYEQGRFIRFMRWIKAQFL